MKTQFNNEENRKLRFFVTGGSRGLGAGIVMQAIREGHSVAFSYINNEKAASEVVGLANEIRSDCKCIPYQLDVSDPNQVEAVVTRILDDFDGVDVVVNSAGINRDNLVASMSDEEWDQVVRTNLTGPFYVCRQILPSMISQRFGRIINISSIQFEGGSGQANYAASKAGLHGFTKTLAKEYGRRGINANVVVPGFFETDMTQKTMPQKKKDLWAMFCPLPDGRMGKPIDLAKVVTFLASDGGNFINGEIINVTGGMVASM